MVDVVYLRRSWNDHSSLVNECVLQHGAREEADAATAERLGPQGPTRTMCSQSVTVAPSSLQRLFFFFDVGEAFKFNSREAQSFTGFDMSQEKRYAIPDNKTFCTTTKCLLAWHSKHCWMCLHAFVHQQQVRMFTKDDLLYSMCCCDDCSLTTRDNNNNML